MSAYSKSLFTNNTVFSNIRSLINPISFAIAVQTIGTGTSQELDFLTQYYMNIIRLIQTDYSSKIANQTYEAIPTDYSQYTNLVKEVQDMRSKTTNASVLLLLQIAEDTLRGAFNSLSLYGDNLLLQLDKADLQKQVADILSDKNVTSIQSSMSTNNMTLTQSFQLAPVFNYYIRIYGAPLQGQGFDPVKIAFLIYTLQENGVDPYS
ncbi:hypothetical protein OAS95_03525 [Pelagibacteraceae bacterium]|nr:hypothetical protein [Pelagibacteraceae bacterium]